jgi:hypothetical protein
MRGNLRKKCEMGHFRAGFGKSGRERCCKNSQKPYNPRPKAAMTEQGEKEFLKALNGKYFRQKKVKR